MKLQEAVIKTKENNCETPKDSINYIMMHISKFFNFKTQNIEFELRELLNEEEEHQKGNLKIKL